MGAGRGNHPAAQHPANRDDVTKGTPPQCDCTTPGLALWDPSSLNRRHAASNRGTPNRRRSAAGGRATRAPGPLHRRVGRLTQGTSRSLQGRPEHGATHRPPPPSWRAASRLQCSARRWDACTRSESWDYTVYRSRARRLRSSDGGTGRDDRAAAGVDTRFSSIASLPRRSFSSGQRALSTNVKMSGWSVSRCETVTTPHAGPPNSRPAQGNAAPKFYGVRAGGSVEQPARG